MNGDVSCICRSDRRESLRIKACLFLSREMLVLLLTCAVAQQINIEAYNACVGDPFEFGNTLDIGEDYYEDAETYQFVKWTYGILDDQELCGSGCGWYQYNETIGMCQPCSASLAWVLCDYEGLNCDQEIRNSTMCALFEGCQWLGSACEPVTTTAHVTLGGPILTTLPPPSSLPSY